MKKISKNKAKSKDNAYEFPPKTDLVFRIHMKKNTLGNLIVLCFELPNGEQYVRNYGDIPSHNLLIGSEGQEFELFVDGKFEGMMKLVYAGRDCFTYEKVE